MFRGQYLDDVTGEDIEDGNLVELTIKHPAQTKTLHVSLETFNQLLEDSEDLSTAFFKDDD